MKGANVIQKRLGYFFYVTEAERSAIVRFSKTAALFRKLVGMRFQHTSGGRMVLGVAYRHGVKYMVFFHPFTDSCVPEWEGRHYVGAREFMEVVDKIRNMPPPPPKHKIGYQRTRPAGFHRFFKKVTTGKRK